MKRFYRNQAGAISIFVMMAMLFFLFTILGVYLISAKRSQTQTETLKLTKEKYYSENADEIYETKIAKESIIPIYSKEHLLEIGTGKAVEIDGKVHMFSNEVIYELKNDIVLNINSDFALLNYDLVFGSNKKVIGNYKILGYYDETEDSTNNGKYYIPTNYNTNSIYEGTPTLSASGANFSNVNSYSGTNTFSGNYYLFAILKE